MSNRVIVCPKNHPTHTVLDPGKYGIPPRDGDGSMQRLKPTEAARLEVLARSLDRTRTFSVVRSVLVGKFPRLNQEIRTFPVQALNAAEAGKLGDAAKFKVEYDLGHHHGKHTHKES